MARALLLDDFFLDAAFGTLFLFLLDVETGVDFFTILSKALLMLNDLIDFTLSIIAVVDLVRLGSKSFDIIVHSDIFLILNRMMIMNNDDDETNELTNLTKSPTSIYFMPL